MSRIPKTDAQLGTSIIIRAVKGDLNVDSLNNAESLAALAQSSVKIGAIQSFSDSTPRPTTPRRELDADNPGEIVERIPQLVERQLTINRAALYKNDILQAFGFTDAQDIIDQDIPFVIVKVERAPTSSNIPTRTTVYTGCWFHDNPKEWSIQGDLVVMQHVEVGYVKKFVV